MPGRPAAPATRDPRRRATGRAARPPSRGTGPRRGTRTGLGRPAQARPRPGYPPATDASVRDTVTVLHLAGPDFGRGGSPTPSAAVCAVTSSSSGTPARPPRPAGRHRRPHLVRQPRECDQALSFLTAVRSQLDLPPQRVIVVPGTQDVNQAACRGYFHTCEADEIAPQPPYWPKWRHYTRLFRSLYQGLDTVFDSDQPWTLFPIHELNTVVAGFNSSMAFSHRPDDQYGAVGRDQAAWFAEALRGYEEEGWLRIGAVRHPLDATRHHADTAGGPGPLRDADVLTRLTGPASTSCSTAPPADPAPPGRTRPQHGRGGSGPAARLRRSRAGPLPAAADRRRRCHPLGRPGPAAQPPGSHPAGGAVPAGSSRPRPGRRSDRPGLRPAPRRRTRRLPHRPGQGDLPGPQGRCAAA
ncbi:hypothetical protein NKH18_11280 [Streptomyces sp. M10(2022)]